jgi:hypothetical protein
MNEKNDAYTPSKTSRKKMKGMVMTIRYKDTYPKRNETQQSNKAIPPGEKK